MDGIGETLKQKAGPLPVWAWAVVGTALLAGIFYYRQKKAASTAQTADTTSGTPTQTNLGTVPISNLTTTAQPMPITMGDTFVDVAGTSASASATGGGGGGGGGGNGGGGGGGGAGGTSTSTGGISTGAPGGAGGAGGIVNPSPPPAAPAPKPVTPPPAAPTPVAKTTTMTVCPWPAWCGSLSGIAQHYYGNGNLWPQIYNANKAKIGSNPNLIKVGTILTIPAKS